MSSHLKKLSLCSMTGYGSANVEKDNLKVQCEMRSYNFRGLDVKIHLPKEWSFLEPLLLAECKKIIYRGKVEISLALHAQDKSLAGFRFRPEIAKEIIESLRNFGIEYQDILKPEVKLGDLLGVPEFFTRQMADHSLELVQDLGVLATKKALLALVQSRLLEGTMTRNVMLKSLENARICVSKIAHLSKEWPERRMQVLKERIQYLLGGSHLDEIKIIQEVALMAEKFAIDEEIERVNCHFDSFEKSCLKECVAVGKKLEFLGQEMLREANTIGSKCNDKDIACLMVELKSEIEKIREQVQNIE